MWGVIAKKTGKMLGGPFDFPIQAENYIKRILGGSTGVKIIRLK